ncbi:single-stranded DNA-binding protein [Magnetospirillum moscoviense]|uniref:Single-stranded DNA-binding protein n=1 Tax=Magnetospirillum moscoviense TaxID=1437059 RepID=A0A178MAK9_9PROT|nr:single-stranded DNA-binding protein [Magnetospirillum moscoviense]OAN45566.1 hypothetical protein A6A05_16795 [Magnetospirillum moscoviense]
MFNSNIAMLVGRLGADAEIKTLPNGKVATMSLAVDQNFKNRAGKWQTTTHWFRVVTYLPWLIDNVIASEATKGRPMFIHGSLRARSWEQEGKKYNSVEIEVDHTGGIVPVGADSTPLNQVMVTGRLGGHADIKTLPGQDGGKMASFSLAADRSFKDRAGEWQHVTDWLRVVTFQSSLIEKVLAKQATKGRLVVVQGVLRAREWGDKDGEVRTSIEIEVDGSGSIFPVLEDKAA